MNQISEIYNKLSSIEKNPYIIGIDGRCASGKTTFANILKDKYNATIIHMDEFFLQDFQRSKERDEEIGGNVDYERVLKDVLIPLSENKGAIYQPYSCQVGKLLEEKRVNPKGIIIIEGSYSMHPSLIKYYDLKIYLTIDQDKQLQRIKNRESEDKVEMFINKWIPLEEKYFNHYDLQKMADYTIKM